MPDISDNTNWFETDNANDRPPPAGWPEGQMPSTVNDCARAMMGAIKRAWDRINPTEPTINPSGALWQYNTTEVAYPVAYVTGEIYCFLAGANAVGGDQFQVNSLGAKPVYKPLAGGTYPTVANDWVVGSMPSVAYRADLNAGAGGWLLLSTPYLPITSDGAGDLNFPGNVTFAGNVGVTGALAVTGAVVFTSTLAVEGHVGLGGGLAVTGGASIDNLTVTSNLAVDGTATINGGITTASGISCASIDCIGGATIANGLTVNGAPTALQANGSVIVGNNLTVQNTLAVTNGITAASITATSGHFSSLQADNGSLLQNGLTVNPTGGGTAIQANGNVVVTNNLTVQNALSVTNAINAGAVTAGGITSNGNLSVAGQVASGSVNTGGVSCSSVASSGNVSSNGGQVLLDNNGISFFGGNNFAFGWTGPGPVELYVERSVEGYMLYSNTLWHAQADTITGGPTGYVIDFTDTSNTVYRVFCDAVSDVRLKKNIHDTKVDALAAILATPVREFEFKVDYQKQYGAQPVPIGLVAQEVKELMPGVVVVGDKSLGKHLADDMHWINLPAAVPYLIRAVQQLTARVAELEGAHA